MGEMTSNVPPELQEQINEAQAGAEEEKRLGHLCTYAFANEGQMEAQGITDEMQQAARDELTEMGYDMTDAQMRANNRMSPGQIRAALRMRREG